MNLAELLMLSVKVSIALNVFALGLQATMQDATYLLRNPGLILRSLLAMNVIMPIVAGILVYSFNLDPAVKIALVALSISPVPPILPGKQLKAGAGAAHTFGLLVAASLLAIVTVPITLEIFASLFDKTAHMPPGVVAMLVISTVLAPLAAGIVLRAVAPALAEKIAKPLAMLATAILVIGVLPVVFVAMPDILSLIGNGTLAAIITFVIVGLAAGHFLGGGTKSDYGIALALSTASRHPGMALAIVNANFPEQKKAAAAVLLYLFVSTVVSIPYVKWRQRQLPDSPLRVNPSVSHRV